MAMSDIGPESSELDKETRIIEELGVEINALKDSEAMHSPVDPKGSKAFELTFGDGYQGTLIRDFNWSDEQAGMIEDQLSAKLNDPDQKPISVYWEDREVVWVYIPENADPNYNYLGRIKKGIVKMAEEPVPPEEIKHWWNS